MTLEAGRELDREIAGRVMGWTRHPNGRTTGVAEARAEWCFDYVPPQFRGDVAYRRPIPRYSTDIAAAWEVVERMRSRGWGAVVSDESPRGDGWSAAFGSVEGGTFDAPAPTAPLAICRAALLAMEAP